LDAQQSFILAVPPTCGGPLKHPAPIHLVCNYPTASRYAFLAIIDLVSTAVGYRLDPDARETVRRIKYKYAVLTHRKGKVLEPLGD
jgi:hypothetical protein